MNASRRRRSIVLALAGALAVVLALVLPGTAGAAPANRAKPPVSVQLLSINDFHGNLRPPTGSGGLQDGVPAGGAAYLATALKNLRAGHKNTLTVSAGDNIGASPLISALFHDEPTIDVLDKLGVSVSSVGNHEFDEGKAELLRIQNGGCNAVDGCQLGRYKGADFQYLAANVVDTDRHKLLFPPYEVERVGGVKVGFIGEVLQDTPSIVTADGVKGLQFLPEASTANQYAAELKAQGVNTIVLLLHQGGFQATGGTVNTCTGLNGPVVDIVNGLSPDIDVVFSAHTHAAYNCVIDNKIVTQASSFGRVVTDLELTIDPATDTVLTKTATNHIVDHTVAPDPTIGALVDSYGAKSAPLENRVIGSITADIGRPSTPTGETPLGDLIADSQLAATAPAATGGAVAAFMNPGGIRADLTYAPSGAEAPGQVTYGEAFTVQPFGNLLVVESMTGDAIKRVLEQQPADGSKTLQVAGITYTWTPGAPAGSRVSNLTIGGAPAVPTATYKVVMNNFLAGGGDGFTVFTEGTGAINEGVDLDAFAAYLTAHSPVAPPPTTRITLG